MDCGVSSFVSFSETGDPLGVCADTGLGPTTGSALASGVVALFGVAVVAVVVLPGVLPVKYRFLLPFPLLEKKE